MTYMSVVLSSLDEIAEINSWAVQGWILITIVCTNNEFIAYFGKPAS